MLRIDGTRAGRVALVAASAALAAVGIGSERWASAGEGDATGAVPLAASAPSVIVPLAPARILDTRAGVGAPAGPVAPGSTLTLPVTGVGGVPADATGVVVNLTATAADGAGYVTAYPAGDPRPEASVINYSAGEDVANMVTAELGAGGALAIFNDQATVHLVADVAGYLVPGSGAVGPQGPAGPAGPGAQLIDLTIAQGSGQVAGEFGGVRLQANCSVNQTYMQLSSTATNALQVSGVGFAGTTPYAYDVSNAVGTQLSAANPPQPLHFSGLVRNTSLGATYQLELHMSHGSPCRVWGSAIPVG